MTAVLLSDDSSGIYNYYSLQATQGYLSWKTINARAIAYENPLSLWFQLPDGAHADDQLTTGQTIYIGTKKPAKAWLWGSTDSDVGWAVVGHDSTYEWQMFMNFEGTTGMPINVGDVVYLYWTPPSPVSWAAVSSDNYVQLFNGPEQFVINSVSSS